MNRIDRRRFLARAAAGAACAFESSRILRAVPVAQTELGKVKIRDVQTATIMMRYPAHLVRITTDAGISGIGEAFNGPGILDNIRYLKNYVVGQDPLQVEYLWAKMMEATSGHGSMAGAMVSSISGIESALWDLAGKILNVPICTLLGGKYREKLYVYHDTGSPRTSDPGPWVEEALRSREYGFKAMKFDLDWESRGQAIAGKEPFQYRREIWNRTISSEEQGQWVRILEEIIKALGPGYDIGVDCHWNYNTRDALRFAQAVEPLNLWFLEDPVPPENPDALARITAATKTPICMGENLYTRHTFRPFIEKQACDIVNPDPQKCGGLLEAKKIADLADLYYITFACHNMCTPVGTYGSAHVCYAVRNFVALESDSIELPWWKDMIVNDGGKFYPGGYLTVPDKPGLGLELNEEVCKKHLAEGSRWFGE
ncbi:MAG: mandelate racemase/muconate lactonizing enzyme family protein [Bryobacteraceae bacterium]|nr:mandelate racemase/muconate lactonizing enzyme family protein [Bryobacteraceae bacterium]